jgi:site-specific DNA-methyltransferase (adenine-specific)
MNKILDTKDCVLYHGNAIECVDLLPDQIQAVITSPTYWGKRQFTDEVNEFGKQKLEEYVNMNVTLYSKILEKIKDDGSLFIVIQDTYMGSGVSRSHHNHWEHNKDKSYRRVGLDSEQQGNTSSVTAHHPKIKNKSLSGIPYRIALQLVDMGYIWREQIIWEKPNPMPENIKDRVRQSVEYILHFTKKGKYKFHSEEFSVPGLNGRLRLDNQVWKVSAEHVDGHTATFPTKIVKRLLLGVTDKGDIVFDPFLGSGTMLKLCKRYRRKFIGCDLNKKFVTSAVKLASKKEKIVENTIESFT